MTTENQTNNGKGGGAPPSSLKLDDSKDMVYYVFEKNESTFLRHPEDGRSILLKVENKLIGLDPQNEDDAQIITYLSKPENLVQHRAKRVKSLSPGNDRMALGDRLDELLTLSDTQLMAMVPKTKQTKASSRGKMLAAIIEKEVR